MVLEAGYPRLPPSLQAGFRRVTKATILVKKRPDMSDEDFVRYYNTQHAVRAAPVLRRHRCLRYSLTYHLTRDRTLMQDMLRGAAPLLQGYDAICTFVFPSYRDFAGFMYDPEGKALAGDHGEFMVEGEMRMLVGDEFVVFDEEGEDGKGWGGKVGRGE